MKKFFIENGMEFTILLLYFLFVALDNIYPGEYLFLANWDTFILYIEFCIHLVCFKMMFPYWWKWWH